MFVLGRVSSHNAQHDRCQVLSPTVVALMVALSRIRSLAMRAWYEDCNLLVKNNNKDGQEDEPTTPYTRLHLRTMLSRGVGNIAFAAMAYDPLWRSTLVS